MNRRQRPLLLTSVIVFALPLGGSLCAQVPDPMVATQAPVAGAGHHYIGTGAETIDPADGSLTFDLPIQTPAGRELSFPFGIRYSSSEEQFLTNQYSGNLILSLASYWEYGQSPNQVGAWGYDLPIYTDSNHVIKQAVDFNPNNCNAQGCTLYPYMCYGVDSFVFRGLDGTQYALNLGAEYGDYLNQQNDPYYQPIECNLPPQPQTQQYLINPSNNHGILSTIQTGQNGYPSGLTVVDQSGTTYQFPFGGATEPVPDFYNPISLGAMATSITDRNGNQMTLASNGLGYMDTLNRSIVSWTGIGNNGDQIAIAGLQNPVTVYWIPDTLSFPNYSSSNYSIYGAGGCSVEASSGVSTPVVSEIKLPNGQAYKFDYSGYWNTNGNPYGKLDQITFPDGGWVRYTWGYNQESQHARAQWTVPPSLCGSSGCDDNGGLADCDVYYSIPAVIERQVSYDGVHVALDQHFTYNPPNWNGSTWSTKSTVVTSTDNLTGQTTTVTYTYGAEYGDTGVFSGGVDQVPVETTVAYSGSAGGTKTVYKTWFGPHIMVGEQTILDGDTAHATTTENCYDGNEQLIETVNFDFASDTSGPYNPDGCYADPIVGKVGPFSAGSQNYDLNTSAIGPALRKTVTTYQPYFQWTSTGNNNPAIVTGTHIVNAPSNVTTCTGATNQYSSTNSLSSLTPSCPVASQIIAQTSYLYDKSAVLPSGAQTGLVGISGTRANITSASKWLNTTGYYLTTTYTYFDTGQVESITDPCGKATCPDIQGTGHTTYYSYNDSPANTLQTNAYLTTVTYPNTGVGVQHQETFTWGYQDGLLRTHTGQNPNQTTKYWYYTGGSGGNTYDPLMRLTEIDLPDGGESNYYYTDVTTGTGSSMGSTQLICTTASDPACQASSVLKATNVIFDGMGHTVTSQLTSDPYTTDTTTTTYDGFGRVLTVSNPERGTPVSTDGITTYGYDAIGRKIIQIDSDSISSQSWTYSGNSVIYTDEDGNKWQHFSDGLGRLSQVLEPNGSSKSPTMITNYGYDLQNNLISVGQNGVSGTDTPRTPRTFTYDSLSRLLCASNPENSPAACPTAASTTYTPGTTGYTYDANGNVMIKKAPLPNSPSTQQLITNYIYDNLNRIRSKYSNDLPMTPISCFQYDIPITGSSDSDAVGTTTLTWTQQPACPSTALSNFAQDAITSRAILSHDPMGRVLSEEQCTPSNCASNTKYSLNYTYDSAGNVAKYSNGVNTQGTTTNWFTFTQTFDAANRLQSIVNNLSSPISSYPSYPPNLFTVPATNTAVCSQPGYSAPGLLESAAYGSGLTVCRTQDSRLQVTGEVDTGVTLGSQTQTTGSAAILLTGGEQSN